MINNRTHVTAKAWRYGDGFRFPEEDLPEIDNRPPYGIAISGGGNRSAGVTAGYLRALNDLGLLERVKYISSVSGGSWAAVPFTYLPGEQSDTVFLGEYVPPEKLTFDTIRDAHKESLTYAISESVLIDDYIDSIVRFKNDEKWAHIVNAVYLKPFGIGKQRKFFSWSKKTVDEILSRPGNDEIDRDDFVAARPDRPYLIAGGILSRSNPFTINRYPFEMTPLYSGIPPFFEEEGSQGRYDLGGGYVESFAFDTDSPDTDSYKYDLGVSRGQTVRVRLRKKINVFSLADVIGTSGAAPAEHLDRFSIESDIEIGFPEFKYWSPMNPEKAKEYDFADGGLLDNTGIMPLLRRGVTKIVCLVNTDATLETKNDVSEQIQALFVMIKNHFGMGDFDKNIVLTEPGKDGKTSWTELRDALLRLHGDYKPAVVRRRYVTVDNKHYQIRGGDEVEIVWVHNAFVKEWHDRIKDRRVADHVDELLADKNFPNTSTFFTNPPKIIDLTLKQANLLAHHAASIVMDHDELFRGFLA